MVAAREDRESFLAPLGLSLADTARLLRVSTSGIAKAVARAERPSVHCPLSQQRITSALRSLIALGATRKDLAKVIASPTPRAAA